MPTRLGFTRNEGRRDEVLRVSIWFVSISRKTIRDFLLHGLSATGMIPELSLQETLRPLPLRGSAVWFLSLGSVKGV